jgi:hypothetical protein
MRAGKFGAGSGGSDMANRQWRWLGWMVAAVGGAAAAAEPDWDRLDKAATPLVALEAALAWETADPSASNRLAQEIARLHAEAGEPARALATFPFGPGGMKAVPAEDSLDALGPDFRCQPAVPVISTLAAGSRFVFVNEAHHVPQTRALSFALLRELRGRGFTHFALEALSEPGAVLAARGHPTRSSGGYLQEPVFGELVREALRLGYTLVEYEDLGDGDMEAREATQARQLWERTLGTDPDARVLVHAGYAHVDLAVGRLWEVLPLAGRIAARAPPGSVLGIDQVDLRHDPKGREHPRYRALLAAFPSSGPLACMTGGAPWALDTKRNTLSIVLPDPGPEERPEWLTLGGTRRAIAAPTLCADTLPCLIEARYADEGEDAVPADRCVQRDPMRCRLYLRPGDYRLRGSDTRGAKRQQFIVRVTG